jgi:hypothetical protein
MQAVNWLRHTQAGVGHGQGVDTCSPRSNLGGGVFFSSFFLPSGRKNKKDGTLTGCRNFCW